MKLCDLKENERLATYKIGLKEYGKFIETYAVVSLKEIVFEENDESVERGILKRRRYEMIGAWIESWGKSVEEQGDKLRPADAIKESEEKFRAIFDNSPVAITLTDKDERIILWNPHAKQSLSMDDKELRNKQVESLDPPE